MTLEEQETHISYTRDKQIAYVYTTDRTTMTKLDRLCREHPENYQCTGTDYFPDDHELAGKKYTIKDKTLISFRSTKMRRELTEEQRTEMSNRMRLLREAQIKDF